METIQEVMTANPVTVEGNAPVSEAARMMRDNDIGDVLVRRPDGSICGIITDRDLAVKVIAEGGDPNTVTAEDVCSHHLEFVAPGDPVDRAVSVMRDRAIRRLPVMDDGRLVGIVSLGDLAMERDPRSALADISEAAPNN